MAETISIQITAENENLLKVVNSTISSLKNLGLKVNQLDSAGNSAGKLSDGLSKVNSSSRLAAGGINVLALNLSSFINIANGVVSVVETIGRAVGSVVEPMITLNARTQDAMTAFTQMLGSAEAAEVFIEKIDKFASETNFETQPLTDMSQKMLAVGFAADQVIPTLTGIGNAVAGLGGSAEKLDRVSTAIAQIKSKGRVQGEELLQMMEAGIPAADILQEKLGLTAEQVGNIGNESVDADKAIQALIEGMNERFPDMMKKQSDNFNGMISTIKDNVALITREIGKPVFELANRWVKSMRDASSQILSAIKDGDIARAFRDMIPAEIFDELRDIKAQWDIFAADVKRLMATLSSASSGALKSLGESFLRILPSLLKVADIMVNIANAIAPAFIAILRVVADILKAATGHTDNLVVALGTFIIVKQVTSWIGGLIKAYGSLKAAMIAITRIEVFQTMLTGVMSAIRGVKNLETAVMALRMAFLNLGKSNIILLLLSAAGLLFGDKIMDFIESKLSSKPAKPKPRPKEKKEPKEPKENPPPKPRRTSSSGQSEEAQRLAEAKENTRAAALEAELKVQNELLAQKEKALEDSFQNDEIKIKEYWDNRIKLETQGLKNEGKLLEDELKRAKNRKARATNAVDKEQAQKDIIAIQGDINLNKVKQKGMMEEFTRSRDQALKKRSEALAEEKLAAEQANQEALARIKNEHLAQEEKALEDSLNNQEIAIDEYWDKRIKIETGKFAIEEELLQSKLKAAKDQLSKATGELDKEKAQQDVDSIQNALDLLQAQKEGVLKEMDQNRKRDLQAFAKAMAEAQFETEQTKLEAAARTQEEQLNQQSQELDDALEHQKISIKKYWDERLAIETKSLRTEKSLRQHELEAAQKQLDQTPGEVDKEKIRQKIEALKGDIQVIDTQIDGLPKAFQRNYERDIADLDEAVKNAQLQLAEATGQGLKERLEAVDKEYETLLAKLQAEGNEQGVDIVVRLKNVEKAKLQFEETMRQLQQLENERQLSQQWIDLQADQGQMSELEAEYAKYWDDKAYAEQLRDRIQNLSKNVVTDEDRNQLDQLQLRLQAIDGQLAPIEARFKSTFQDSLTDLLAGGIDDCKSLGDAFKKLGSTVINELRKIAAQELTSKITQGLFGSDGLFGGFLGGSDGGGWLSGLFGFAGGGQVSGPGTGTSDSILAKLSNGEWVMRAAAVKHYGPRLMDAINRMSIPRTSIPRFATGGLVGDRTLTANFDPNNIINLEMVNLVDYGVFDRYLESSTGKRKFLNILSDKRDSIRKVIF